MRGESHLRPPFIMRALRSPVCVGLLLVILTAGSCRKGSREDSSLLELLMDAGRAAQQQQVDHGQASGPHPPKRDYSIETREVNEVNKSYQHDQILGR